MQHNKKPGKERERERENKEWRKLTKDTKPFEKKMN